MSGRMPMTEAFVEADAPLALDGTASALLGAGSRGGERRFRRAARRRGRRLPRPAVPLWGALILSAAGGALYDTAFPAQNAWPLVFPALALLLLAVRGRGVWAALLVGFVGGLAFWLTDIDWMSFYLGPLPWLAMCVTQSAFMAVSLMLIALAWRWVPQAWPGAAGRLVATPLVVAGLWTLREGIADRWPFHGFAWGRAALSQSQSPFAGLTAYIGVAGLSFLLLWLTAFAIQSVAERRRPWLTRAGAPAIAVCVALAVPAWPVHTHGTMDVAAVQGNGPAGYFQPHRLGDVENAQIAATIPLIGAKPDLVVWPEGAADVDPLENTDSADVLSRLSTAVGAPLLVGAITPSGSRWYNSSVLWDGGSGYLTQYDKQHPVPFGEYMPARAFFHLLVPQLVDLIQRDYSIGTRSNVMTIGGVKAGISICFDIVDDWQTSEMARGGAQLIIAQTNNADFIDPSTGKVSEENVQQLAAARLRAISSSKALVNVSTVGTSQIIGPDGRTIQSIPADNAGYLRAEVPLSTQLTPAMLDDQAVETFVSAFGLLALLAAGLLRLASSGRTRTGRAPKDPARVDPYRLGA